METPEQTDTSRAEQRLKFAEVWLTRFFDLLDSNLDEVTLKKIMMANGRVCFLNWIKETGQKITPMTLEEYTARVKNRGKDDAVKVDGNIIYFQFMSAAETGLPSEEGQCLCTLVESCPKGLSPTYCHCSVGYVKECYDQIFGRPVEVELLESVLRGGKRCRFKIMVP